MSQNFPSEKVGHNRSEIIPPDIYLGVTWDFLKDYNTDNLRKGCNPGSLPFLVTSTPVVEAIFQICQLLDQPSEVRFMAVDLFDRFMVNHYLDVNKQLDATTANRSSRRRQWRSLRTRIRKQALLRALSCIQIASKVVLSSKKLNKKTILRVSVEYGHSYSLRSIACSEQRVLKTVNFEISFRNPLTYVEVLLACLREKLQKELRDDTETIPSKPTLYSVCVSVLDVATLQRQELFHRLFWMHTSRWERTPQERAKFLEIECDMVFLAASVILCAIHIWKNNVFIMMLVGEKLSQLTDIPVKQIKGLATLMLHSVFGGRPIDVLP